MKAGLPTVGFIIVVVWLLIGGGALFTGRVASAYASVGIPGAPSLMPFYAAIVFAALETTVILYHGHISRRAFIIVSAALIFAALMFISYGAFRIYEATVQFAGGHLQTGKESPK